MTNRKSTLIILWALALLCSIVTGSAANLTANNNTGSGSSWLNPVWKTNGVGTAVAPVAGNSYELIYNGIQLGNNTSATRTRNPTNNGLAAYVFPGDSLQLDTNTEIRFKNSQAAVPIPSSFPGVGNNPGLILNGGMLNAGDASIFVVTGRVAVIAQSYLCPGNSDGAAAADTARAVSISAQLSGAGNLVLWQGNSNQASTISGTSNTYTGQWIVKAGLLRGTATNSLGTNSITCNPNFALPITNGDAGSFSNNIIDIPGPAVLEVNYDLNSSGVLTLVNGGVMRLHQNCEFTSVVIEGTALSPGTHFLSELQANFPANFTFSTSGSLTVQPFGPPPPIGPIISANPLAQAVYSGKTARFSGAAVGPAPITYSWLKNGVKLSDGGNISGSTNTTLTVSNVGPSDATGYAIVAANLAGSVTSSVASLTIQAPSGEAAESAVIADNPFAYYRLNETVDPSTTNAVAFDFAGGFVGTYGLADQNGFTSVPGPRPTDGFPGFSANNTAALFTPLVVNSRLNIVYPWNMNTNTVTITAWINPNNTLGLAQGIVFCRGNGTTAGLNTSGAVDANGIETLSYTWNNEFETYTWNSGLEIPVGVWSFVSLVVTPTNATLNIMNTNGIVSATHVYPHVVQNFSGATTIGDDVNAANGTRVFTGSIDDVAVFNTALTRSQVVGLFTAASGVATYAPLITSSPTNLNLYAGQTAVFTAGAGGSDPLTFQWQHDNAGDLNYVNIANGGRFSGADTATLTIQNVGPTDANNYRLRLSNPINFAVSSPAFMNVSATSSAQNITSVAFEPSGADWDTVSFILNAQTVSTWTNGQSASFSAASQPGSTFELLPSLPIGGVNQGSALLRSPQNPRTATFPGAVLQVDGNGVWVNGPTTNTTTIAEIRFKQPSPGSVIFPDLKMNGGQLDVGNDGLVQVFGKIEILTNTPIYNDNASLLRGYEMDAQLTGTGTIEYHGYNLTAFQPGNTNNLDITGTSNTFSGKWNVVIGNLLGTGSNSLGTNDIIISTNSALETTYDINNPNANLFLTGRLYLHQNDTFRSLFINGVPVAVGVYTASQLATTYPANFPTNWTPQVGATNFSAISGSITVLVQPVPQVTQQPTPATLSLYPGQSGSISVAAQGNLPLFYFWRRNGTPLTDGLTTIGSSTTNITLTNVVSTNGGNYDVIVSNSIGTVTSLVSVVTILTPGPVTNITLDFGGAPVQEPQNNDWDSLSSWSDGQAASVSVFSNPGSSYDIVDGARLRTPVGGNSRFPGQLLTVEGTGIFVNNNDSTTGELRLKHSADPATEFFTKLVLNGGQLDTGDNGLVIVQGELNVAASSIIYVDNAAAQDRSYQFDAKLTGSGGLFLHAYSNIFAGDFNFTSSSNTYTGAWNIDQGSLLGSGLNSLGTNSIFVSTNSALETAYDDISPNATLTVNGQVFLHQNDNFGALTVNGTSMPLGTYTFATLHSQFPTNFPSTWPLQLGSTVTNASGSITVGPSTKPPTLAFTQAGSHFTLNWAQGTLQETTNLLGTNTVWTAVSGAAAGTPFNVTPTDPKHFYRVRVP